MGFVGESRLTPICSLLKTCCGQAILLSRIDIASQHPLDCLRAQLRLSVHKQPQALSRHPCFSRQGTLPIPELFHKFAPGWLRHRLRPCRIRSAPRDRARDRTAPPSAVRVLADGAYGGDMDMSTIARSRSLSIAGGLATGRATHLFQRARWSELPSSNRPIEGPPQPPASSSGAPQSKTLAGVR